ncbi:MAG: OmpA family protein [Candidatus Omnitrophota bacterium]
MRNKKMFLSAITAAIVLSFMTSGCMVNFYKQNPRNKKKIQELQCQISNLEFEKQKEQERFKEVESILERRFHEQIKDKTMSLEMDDRGLVIILSDNILFDSGKAEVKKEAYPVLNNVVKVVKTKVPDKNIGISGHTDNVSIKQSKWPTNWELSTARATNVLHYLESQGISSSKLSATGYGKHRPVASNSTKEGQARNRRVEIVILPEFVKKSGDILGVQKKEATFVK